MKNNIAIELYLLSPINFSEIQDSDMIYNIFNKMVNELQNMHIDLVIYGHKINFTVNIKKDKSKHIRKYGIYSMNTTIDLDALFHNDYKQNENSLREQDLACDSKNVTLEIFFDDLEKCIYDLTLAINLSYPGFFEFNGGLIQLDDINQKNIHGMINDFLHSYELSLMNQWPKITLLDVMGTWKWLNSKTTYIDGMGKYPIDRALNALSYSFNVDYYEDLFYSLLGIEAIYNTDQGSSIMEQIKTKTAKILGKPNEYKKKINKMYDIRSRFIHGRLEFPSKFYIHDAREYINYLLQDYRESVITATSILIATIQIFIKNNANELITDFQLEFKANSEIK